MDNQNNAGKLSFAVVSKDEAKMAPYPYVYINDDGTVRELHQSERDYLETAFYPTDGNRPYVKNSYRSKDGWGSIEGFCLRSNVPSNITVLEAPTENPSKTSQKKFLEKQIKLATQKGFEIIENPDGSMTLRRKPKS